jgi:histidinol-phosphate aminotransferase
MIKVPEYIQNLKSYKPGNALKSSGGLSKIEKFINLASNENPMGPSPKAIEALHDSGIYLSRYPDVGSTELVEYLAGNFNKKPGQIICGHGSDSLIADIIKAFSDFGDEVIIGSGTFIGYFVNIQKLGRKIVTVPLDNYSLDLDFMISAITLKTRIIFIPNPNNPTGIMINKNDLELFISKVPDDVLIVLDEAYFIYSEILDGYPNCMNYDLPNVIVLRTMSKSHGLAGVRIGFAIGPEELISTIYKVKLPFEPNIIAQKIAKAALEDKQFVFETVKLNTITLSMILTSFNNHGIKYAKPAANFVMVILESEQNARNFTDFCYNRGILIRHLPPFGIPECVRISTGLIQETKTAVNVFLEFFNN